MARSDAVWGIDIGNSSLKALRCRPSDDSSRIVADAFDFIEYPKILTQPGADPAELVSEALTQFLSRNSVRGDQVAISVSGQTGLARFIKLPPVAASKIPDIIKYEARQQIPFDLNDVIWDYQRIGGGAEEEGFLLECEVGLFAMKRDQVFRALEPFSAAGIDVDYVQLAPLALYNFAAFDQLTDLPAPEDYDPENPPPSVAVLSMGTDASDLVITNGFKVWQRSIPIGGNHFTKALTKELKLTFAKAEHLKRNAATAEDPKAVFQAMRPVFNDLLTEIQRSLNFFTNLERSAKIQQVLAMGNPIKLPGLRRFLAQGLGYDVVRLDGFQNMSGSEVTGAPAFQENQLCFPVCYGLALQGLRKAAVRTNLLPKEIVKDRIIKAKKPWAVAAAAVLLLGFTVSLASYSRALATVDTSKDEFKNALTQVDSVVSKANNFKSQAGQVVQTIDGHKKTGQNLVENVGGRLRWLELLKAVSECLPKDANAAKKPADERFEVHIDGLDCYYMESLATWYTHVSQNPEWLRAGPPKAAASAGSATPAPTGSETAPADAAAGPQGSGWLIVLQGHHYRNPQRTAELTGAEFVRQTLMDNLTRQVIELPTGNPAKPERATMAELGISYPALINPKYPVTEVIAVPMVGTPGSSSEMGSSSMAPAGYGSMPGTMPGTMPGSVATGPNGVAVPTAPTQLKRFDFLIHFVWQPTTQKERMEKRAKAAEAAAAAAPADGVPAADGLTPAAPAATPGQAAPAAPAPGTPPTAPAAPPATPAAPPTDVSSPAPAASPPAPAAAAPVPASPPAANGATPPAASATPAAPSATNPTPPAQP